MKLIKGLLISGFTLVGASTAFAGGISSQLVYDCAPANAGQLFTDSAATTPLVLGSQGLVKSKELVQSGSSYVESDVCVLDANSNGQADAGESQLYASDAKTYSWNSGFTNEAASYAPATCAVNSSYQLVAGKMVAIADCAGVTQAYSRTAEAEIDVIGSVAQEITAHLEVAKFCKIDGIADRVLDDVAGTPTVMANRLSLVADTAANTAALKIPGQPGSVYFGQATVEYSCTFAPALSIRAIDKDLCVKDATNHVVGTADCLRGNNLGQLFIAAAGNSAVNGDIGPAPVSSFTAIEGAPASRKEIVDANEAVHTLSSRVALGEKRKADVAIAAKIGPSTATVMDSSAGVEYEGIFQVILSDGL